MKYVLNKNIEIGVIMLKYYKIIFLLVFFMFIVLGCANKDKIDTSTTFIEVSPSGSIIAQNDTLSFTAKVYTSDRKVLDKTITWSVEGGEENGTISTTGIYKAPSIVSNPLTVVVRAETSGIVGSAQIRVLQAVDINVKERYYFYMDEWSTDLLDFKADTDNPPDVDGGFLGADKIDFTTDESVFFEGNKSLKVTNIGGSSYNYGGFWFQFGYKTADGSNQGSNLVSKDLSAYVGGSLNFWVKTNDQDMQAKIECGNSVSVQTTVRFYVEGNVLDNTWQFVKIPLVLNNLNLNGTLTLTAADLAQLQRIVFWFKDILNTDETANVDKIYLEVA